MEFGISNNQDRNREIDELCKGEEIYRTQTGRYLATGHIIKKYMQTKMIGYNPKTKESAMTSVINTVSNKEFINWTIENYHVYIKYDEELGMFFPHKITDEMLELINKTPFKDLDTKHVQDEIHYLEDRLFYPEKDELGEK